MVSLHNMFSVLSESSESSDEECNAPEAPEVEECDAPEAPEVEVTSLPTLLTSALRLCEEEQQCRLDV